MISPSPPLAATSHQHRPWWATWAPPLTIVGALGYGALRLTWAAGDRPELPPTGDDLHAFADWGAVILCAAALLVAAALRLGRSRGPARIALLAVGAVTVLGLVAAAVLLLLDVVALLTLGGAGVHFHIGAFLSRLGALLIAATLAATVLAAYRGGRGRCLSCGRGASSPPAPRQPSRPVVVVAYLVVVACLVRVAAQLVADVAGGSSPLFDGEHLLAAVMFAVEAVLAGTLLPLALVHRWGRVWPSWVLPLAGRRVPRWLVLGPAAFVGVAMTVYFAIAMGQLAATLGGATEPSDYSAGFFWLVVPAYLVWGIGLCVAGWSYGRITRPACRRCRRGGPAMMDTSDGRPVDESARPANPTGERPLSVATGG